MLRYIWIAIFLTVLIWSGINPHDYFTWLLEIIPALVGLFVLWRTEKTFTLTNLTYLLILIHSVILMIGGHYTYAEVPLFNTLKDVFGLYRNNYDKVAHFIQGLVPAIIVREVFIRRQIITIKHKYWRNILIVSFCLSISALYELIEWVVAICIGESADNFLGTQGYVWDTQSDMGLALLGATIALLALSKIHNKQLSKYL